MNTATSDSNRRLSPRRNLSKDSICYVNGKHIGAFTKDVSVGGSFIDTVASA